ncbi:MAG: hypothetical protein ACI841_002635 [Planctomycetota bacterium]|jgi:hypothetical protein
MRFTLRSQYQLGLRIALPFLVLVTPIVWVSAARTQKIASGAQSSSVRRTEHVTVDLLGASLAEVPIGMTVEFDVRVSGTGGPQDLTLANPQAGLIFEPARGQLMPFTQSVRWTIPEHAGERVDLYFRSSPSSVSGPAPSNPAPGASLTVPIKIKHDAGPMVRVGDVTGDGIPDVVAVARDADRGNISNTGVAFIWIGTSSPTGIPDVTLELSNPMAGDRLGNAASPALQLVDLDRDGILDIVIATQDVDFNFTTNSGAVFAYFGGPGISGTYQPDVVFHQPVPETNDQFGSMPVLFEDLTGDGVPELVAGSTWADIAGVVDAGGYWVWELGPSLRNNNEPSPMVELTIPNPTAGDRLGLAAGHGVQLIDLTGDTIADVVIGAYQADRSGLANLGAIFLWQGGAQFRFLPGPSASLDTIASNTPAAGDQVGNVSGQGIQFVDMTADGRLDVVAGARYADANFTVDTGAVFIWEVSDDLQNMSTSPRMELIIAGAAPGNALGAGNGQTIQFADVTDNGYLDVIVTAELADSNSGRVYIFEGAPFNSGPVDPSAELYGDLDSEQLGKISGQGVFAVDITGDGLLDIVAASQIADVNQLPDMGRIYVWDGALGFNSGQRAADWTLDAPNYGTDGGDRMGDITGPGIQFFEVTGDNTIDLITGASHADVLGATMAGAIYIWRGGALQDLYPSYILTNNLAEHGDQLGRATGQGVRLHDVTGDGIVDLFVGAEFSDHNGVADVGGVHVWETGSALDSPGPLYTFRIANPSAGDRLGAVTGASIQFADLTGDTIDDVIIGSQHADPFGVTNSGAYFVWDGLSLTQGEPPQSSLLTTWGLGVGDQLGRSTVGMLIFDFTDDGVLDLLLSAPQADENSVLNSGALYMWFGGNQIGVDLNPLADVAFTNPSAQLADRLGG